MIARALTDEAFRTRLEQDPRETIETEFQCKVSGDVTFRVREEENPGEMTILLPKLPKKEMGEQLTDREIDDIVAAGNIGIAVGIVTTDITPDMLTELETTLEGMDLGPLLGLWLQSSVIGLTMQIMGIIIFVLVYGRMIEIYLMTSLAPLPVATLSNRELGGTGQNYLKSLFAVGFQGMLILVCVAIYAVLVQGIATGGDPIGAIWGTVGYTVLLCFMLFKTGGIAQRIFGAH